MITDDTILTHLPWIRYERSGESYKIASEKCNAILKYIFPNDKDAFSFIKDGIEIGKWNSDSSYKGIKLEFYDNFRNCTQWRTIEFKGTIKEFKIKVLEKFEVLKKQKAEADNKKNIQNIETKTRQNEIDELQKIANDKFSKNPYGIIPEVMNRTALNLKIRFNTKQELVDYINNF